MAGTPAASGSAAEGERGAAAAKRLASARLSPRRAGRREDELGTHVDERAVLPRVQRPLVLTRQPVVLEQRERVESARSHKTRHEERRLGRGHRKVVRVHQGCRREEGQGRGRGRGRSGGYGRREAASSSSSSRARAAAAAAAVRPSRPSEPSSRSDLSSRPSTHLQPSPQPSMYDPLAPSSAQAASSTPAWPSSPHDPSDLPPHLSPSTPSSSVFRQQQQSRPAPLVKPEEISRPVRLAAGPAEPGCSVRAAWAREELTSCDCCPGRQHVYGEPQPSLVSPSALQPSNPPALAPFLRVKIVTMERNRKDLLVRFDASVRPRSRSPVSHRPKAAPSSSSPAEADPSSTFPPALVADQPAQLPAPAVQEHAAELRRVPPALGAARDRQSAECVVSSRAVWLGCRAR